MGNIQGKGGFKPGKSGNPSGRPKSNAFIVALAQACTEEAIETLAEIMRDETKPTAARVSAAIALLDRGYGKAAQSIAVLNDDKPVLKSIQMVVVPWAGSIEIEGECMEKETPLPLPPQGID